MKTTRTPPITTAADRKPRRKHTAQISLPVSGRVKSADRALSVIELVSQRGVVTFTEVADELSLPRSSAHALLGTLVDAQWLRLVDGQYRLGIRAWLVGRSPAAFDVLVAQVRHVLAAATGETHETTQFISLNGDSCVYLAISPSPNPMRLFSEEGSRLMPHATAVGRAMMAALPVDQFEAMLTRLDLRPLTAKTITDPDALRQRVERIRAIGYETEDEEYVEGSTCVAAAVGTTSDVGLTCGISITTPKYRQPAGWPNPQLAALRTAVESVRAILLGRNLLSGGVEQAARLEVAAGE